MNTVKSWLKKICSGIILVRTLHRFKWEPWRISYFPQLHLSDSDFAINFWMKINHCFGLKVQCAEVTTIRLFSTMFQARGRSISTGPWDICGISVEIEYCWMVINDFVYVSCSLIQTCVSDSLNNCSYTEFKVQNKTLTGQLVQHCLHYIMNSFNLVVISWTVPIIKVHLGKKSKERILLLMHKDAKPSRRVRVKSGRFAT